MKRTIGRSLRHMLPASAYSTCCKAFDATAKAGQFLSHQGWGRVCPFCNHRFRKFISDPGESSPLFHEVHVIGGGISPEALCPFCRSFERERHVYLYLKLMTNMFSENSRLLHVAPEKNVQRILSKQKNIQYTTGDIDPTRAQVKVDLTAINFPDNAFDIIICNHVLEHIPDDRKAMSEILRVLRPGGWAMLQVPIAPEIETRENPSINNPDEQLQLFGQRDHVRIYGHDYQQRLESVGFSVTITSIPEKFGKEFASKHGLIPDERIFIATKPRPSEN